MIFLSGVKIGPTNWPNFLIKNTVINLMVHHLLQLAGLCQCLLSAVVQQYPHVDPVLKHEGQSQTECDHMCVGVLKVEEGR